MKIDNNELEMRAMELFKEGKEEEATKLQDEFLAQVKASGIDHCTCPGTGCKFHGNCVECVIIHRGHGDHLPHCFMLNKSFKKNK